MPSIDVRKANLSTLLLIAETLCIIRFSVPSNLPYVLSDGNEVSVNTYRIYLTMSLRIQLMIHYRPGLTSI